MTLREHPKLRPWPPTSGFACPGPTPGEKECGGLMLRNVLISNPAQVTLILEYKGSDCQYVMDVDDRQFARSVCETLKTGRGQSLQQIGDIEISS